MAAPSRQRAGSPMATASKSRSLPRTAIAQAVQGDPIGGADRERPAMNRGPRVPVIDDEPAIHRFLGPALEANGYDVLAAATAGEGLRRIVVNAPEIVVLDLGPPDLDGKEVIARTRNWSEVRSACS